jgi:hypothetical protein
MNISGFKLKIKAEGKVVPPEAPQGDASDTITERDAPTPTERDAPTKAEEK